MRDGESEHSRVGLRQYVLALEAVERYEAQISNSHKHICHCEKCRMIIGYDDAIPQERIENAGGTSHCYGKCPHCGEETLYNRW